jgi:hypothetical protein
MEYIEIEISNYKKLIEFIRIKLLYCVTQSYENDELYIPGKLTLQLINSINEINKSTEDMLNDLYSIIKKYFQTIKEYSKSTISRNNRLSDLKKASQRATLYIKTIYGEMLTKPESNRSDFDFLLEKKGNNKTTNDNLKFKLWTKNYSKMPYCEEYMLYNIVLHEENIYYYRVNDTIYKFFYFYKTEDNIWYWSPPRKTDPEDIWMECPKYIVEEGVWKGTQIPKYVEDFVVWLDVLRPNLPYITYK